jgi:uncharacterized protein YbaR (Trm112 family)
MAINPALLDILVCPETKLKVVPADQPQVDELNRRIAEGALRNRAGRIIQEKIDAGLVRQDGKVLYPIRDDIPVMLIDEGIAIGG